MIQRAVSSEVEHYLDTVGVTGSIPVSPIQSKEKPLNSSIAIVGLGSSGISAAKLLAEEGYKVIILEKENNKKYNLISKELRQEGIDIQLGKKLELKSFEPIMKHLKEVIISPGIRWDHPTLNELRKKNIKVKGEISLAWERLNYLPWIGVTGTNGKTTVTSLLKHVLNTNGLIVPTGGNIGLPGSEIALKLKAKNQIGSTDWLLMELSSYQIETSPEISPKIGIWTNLTPDHLERHGTIERYQSIKQGLIENSQIRIFNADDEFLSNNRTKFSKGIWVSTKGDAEKKNYIDFWINNDGIVVEQNKLLFDSSLLNLPGEHNLQNLLLVTAAARKIGLSAKEIAQSINSFKNISHRLEKLGCIEEMIIYNDSKATNYESATMALQAIKTPIIVIAGGRRKEGDFKNWLAQLKKNTCGIILFGESGNFLKDIIRNSGYKYEFHCCNKLSTAITLAINLGQKNSAKSLLFSPACSSFDSYENYEARGNHFRELISPRLTDQKQE